MGVHHRDDECCQSRVQFIFHLKKSLSTTITYSKRKKKTSSKILLLLKRRSKKKKKCRYCCQQKKNLFTTAWTVKLKLGLTARAVLLKILRLLKQPTRAWLNLMWLPRLQILLTGPSQTFTSVS